MRSYVFTKRERNIIRGFLGGRVSRDDPVLMVTISRVKKFADLRNDVELYDRLRKAVVTGVTWPSLNWWLGVITPAVTNTASATRTNLPSVIFDLVGVTEAVSPENAIRRAFELYPKLCLYKVKYGLKSVEAVFSLLEREALVGNKRALEAEEWLKGIFDNPELIFFEMAGAEPSAVDFFKALQKEGSRKGFLDFVSEIITAHIKENGLELESPEN